MITALAFCPHPPLLVPEVAAGAAPELDELRVACDAALAAALSTAPDRVVLLGGGPTSGPVPDDAVGTLAPYGLAFDVPLDPARQGAARLPLSLTIGAWLLERSGWTGPREAVQVDVDPMGGPGGRRTVADGLAARSDRVAMLVMADGSSSRSEKAPGSYQPGAEAFDAEIRAVLAGGDPSAGLKVKYDDAQSVGAHGWSAWRTAFHAATPGPWAAHLYYDAAPYGVGYLVASWA